MDPHFDRLRRLPSRFPTTKNTKHTKGVTRAVSYLVKQRFSGAIHLPDEKVGFLR